MALIAHRWAATAAALGGVLAAVVLFPRAGELQERPIEPFALVELFTSEG